MSDSEIFVPVTDFQHVLVLATEKHTGNSRWTSGLTTGRTGKHSESFEVETVSPLVKEETAFYHKEDIKDPEQVNSVSSLNE